MKKSNLHWEYRMISSSYSNCFSGSGYTVGLEKVFFENGTPINHKPIELIEDMKRLGDTYYELMRQGGHKPV